MVRKDKQKKLGKVAKELLNNPLATIREIEENTGVSKSTVANYINNDLDKVGQKDDRILGICEEDLVIVKLTQKETVRRLVDEEERKKLNMQDLNRAGEVSTKRYTIFKGDITDDEGGLKKNINDVTII